MTTFTENGAISLANTGSARVDLFFKLVRNIPRTALERLIETSWYECPLDTMKILFQSRDCRGGKGDRTPFILAMQYIIARYPKWFLANFKQISLYGRWLDYIEIYKSDFCNPAIQEEILKHLAETLQKDVDIMTTITANQSVSLLAKWIPSEGKKWSKRSGFIDNLCVKLFNLRDVTKVNSWHHMQLRKQYLSPLRQKIKIVETQMCETKWSEIVYSTVPGVAMTNLNKAFKRHDETRFLQYLDDVKNKRNGAKINADVVYPHTIVEKYVDEYNTQRNKGTFINDVYEMQWKALEDKVTIEDTVVVSDVSGSMDGTPMMVSIALGILLATKNKSAAFKDQLITFDDDPRCIYIGDCDTLLQKIEKVRHMPWGGSTNLQKTFDIIIAKCLLRMENAPKKLIIFSDMQFNIAIGGSSRESILNFDAIINKFNAHNLTMPEIIFWNLRGDTGDFPVSSDVPGVTLLSGFSPTLLNSIMTDVTLTPYDILRQILDNPRYDNIVAPIN